MICVKIFKKYVICITYLNINFGNLCSTTENEMALYVICVTVLIISIIGIYLINLPSSHIIVNTKYNINMDD